VPSREKSMEKEIYEQLVKPRPYLWWWVSDKEKLSDKAIVEAVLTNGEMEEVELLFHLFGRQRVKEIFLSQINKARHNYRAQTVNFFLKVFSQNA
jgi:hypothetical protein